MKKRRGVELLAAFGLVVITGGAVGGLVWRVIAYDDATATSSLAILATAGLSGLLVIAGGKKHKEDPPDGDDAG